MDLSEHLKGQRLQLIDVGARGGLHPRWTPFLSHIDAYGFECDSSECARLNASGAGIRFLPHALGEHDGERAVLNITRQPGCSSLLKPNAAVCSAYPYGPQLDVLANYPVELARLDSICRAEGLRPDVLKIDTQGTELAILRGAGDLLSHMLVVELEVEFVEQYEGQPLFSDVDQFMRRNGFGLRGLKRSCWRMREGVGRTSHGGQLVHADALYVRNGLAGPKAVLALAAYRQFDLALQLGSWADGLLPPPRRWHERLIGRVVNRLSHGNPRGWVDQMRPPTATDWHDNDFY